MLDVTPAVLSAIMTDSEHLHDVLFYWHPEAMEFSKHVGMPLVVHGHLDLLDPMYLVGYTKSKQSYWSVTLGSWRGNAISTVLIDDAGRKPFIEQAPLMLRVVDLGEVEQTDFEKCPKCGGFCEKLDVRFSYKCIRCGHIVGF